MNPGDEFKTMVYPCGCKFNIWKFSNLSYQVQDDGFDNELCEAHKY